MRWPLGVRGASKSLAFRRCYDVTRRVVEATGVSRERVSILFVFQNQNNASNIKTKIKTEGDFE